MQANEETKRSNDPSAVARQVAHAARINVEFTNNRPSSIYPASLPHSVNGRNHSSAPHMRAGVQSFESKIHLDIVQLYCTIVL